jgi:uncharacterized HhH-GPD family protein
MAKRVQALCQTLVDDYGGDAAAIWADPASGKELLARVKDLPGFGDEKAKIFTALLAKRFGVTPDGWEQATHPFSDSEPRSVADIGTRDEFEQVRAWKKMRRSQGKAKSDP